MHFVDTNYFIRFFLGDIPKQQGITKAFFRQAALGKIHVCTSTIVVFEVYWVITSFYKKSKEEAIAILQGILDMDFIELAERRLIRKTLSVFTDSNLSIEDCYNLVYCHDQSVGCMATFDAKLEKKFQQYLAKAN